MKTTLLIVLLSALSASAQTNRPPIVLTVKTTLWVTNDTRVRTPFYIDDPSGLSRTQQFFRAKTVLSSFKFEGSTIWNTNEVVSDRTVMVPMVRTRTLTQGTNPPPLPGGEWTPLPGWTEKTK